MLKLYRREDGSVADYHEAWVADSSIIEHWGNLGETGSTREHRIDRQISEDENIRRVLAPAFARGFEPIHLDDHAVCIIEYAVRGMGTAADLEKRHKLEDRMNETLGWTGLGCCDGGSIGSGTMEVCCLVVEFETARRVIESDLHGTEFADYSRIYDEGAA